MGKRSRQASTRTEAKSGTPCLEALRRDFGSKSETAWRTIRALHDALQGSDRPEVSGAVQRWRATAIEVCGAGLHRSQQAAMTLAADYGLPTPESRPELTLFAVQSYYAVLVRSILGRHFAHLSGPQRSPSQLLLFDGGDDPYAWCLAVRNDSVEEAIRRIAGLLERHDPSSFEQIVRGGQDLFQDLYQGIFPRRVRHALGEYYTPSWLASQMLDEAGYHGQPSQRLLDPACGSGSFLLLAINRLVERGASAPSVLESIVGVDLNPLAVLSARANYLIALGDLAREVEFANVPVYCADSILGPELGQGPAIEPFDYVVGNPPWIAWDDLPDDYREATKPLWRRYGLFSLSAGDARHGGGKKDLSMLMTYAAADHYLKPSGRLAVVITQTLFQTKGAGDGFRRFRLGEEGAGLRVLRVNDLVERRPFPDTSNWTATLVLEKGLATTYPVPYVRWSRQGRATTYAARPIDPCKTTSPWFLWPEGWEGSTENLLGPSDYVAHLGANTGGANGVYWVTFADGSEKRLNSGSSLVRVRNLVGKGKRSVPEVECEVESDLLFPLVCWGDVARFRAVPGACLLLPQDPQLRRGIDEATMLKQWPATYAYLRQFQSALEQRVAYRRYQSRAPFYSMYDVGPYTVAPFKVVWRRMDQWVNAAVIEAQDDGWFGRKPVIPQETCVLVAVSSSDEAHYLCSLLNSAIADFLVRAHSVRGGKGFGTPSMLDYLRLRKFDPGHSAHEQLAAASREAHELAATGGKLDGLQCEIDRLAAKIWDLTPGDLRRILAENSLD